MKVRLTLVYEKEIDPDSFETLQGALEEGDHQMIDETFGIGWDVPEESSLEEVK